MVELLQAPAWAIKLDDVARAKVKSNREMRNFMVPPDFSWKSALAPPKFREVSCGQTLPDTIESACRLPVGTRSENLMQGCKMARLGRVHGCGKSPVRTVRFGYEPLRIDSGRETGAHGTHPYGSADPAGQGKWETDQPRGDHRATVGKGRLLRHRQQHQH